MPGGGEGLSAVDVQEMRPSTAKRYPKRCRRHRFWDVYDARVCENGPKRTPEHKNDRPVCEMVVKRTPERFRLKNRSRA